MIRKLPADVEAGEEAWFEAASRAKCPPPDLLTAALGGVTSEEVAATVRQHVKACDACRLLADVLMADDESEPTAEEAARIRRRVDAAGRAPSWRWAVAAAVLLAAGGLLVLRLGWRAAPPTPTAAASPPGSGAPPPAAPAFALALAAPALELPESALVLRGGPEDPYAAALARALEPYQRGDYAGAVERLRDVTRNFPRQPHAAFYLGASLLMLGRAREAEPALTEAGRLARDEPWLAAEAAWYRAVALERAGRPEAAAQALAPLCSGHGPRREAACDAQRRLAGTGRKSDGGQGASEPDRGRSSPPADPGTTRAGARPVPRS